MFNPLTNAIQVMKDGRLEWRPISHVQVNEGRGTLMDPVVTSRVIPVTYENEELQWVLGSEHPHIVTVKAPSHRPEFSDGPFTFNDYPKEF